MSKTLSLLATLFITFLTFAQAPEGLNYQGVVRDASGNILSSQSVGIQFNIKQGTALGATVYSETWTVNTNAQGVVIAAVGSGMTTDDFSTIDWSNGPYFLDTSVDITGGTNYVSLGTSQLLSVPYALHSKIAGNGLPSGQTGDVLFHDGSTWVTLPKGTDGQILTLSGGLPTWSNQCVNVFYLDADNDGYGDATMIIVACEVPAGYVTNKGDCDDTNVNINPDATEICGDNIDNDCDGLIDSDDPSATGTSVWYQDTDGDGYGNDAITISSCTLPQGYTATAGDCNDLDAGVNPDAIEICNDGIDNDCDGLTDAEDTNTSGGTTWYEDNDGDNFGTTANTITACVQPIGYVANNGDCNDNDASSYPGAPEICGDNVDNDCDGLTDGEDTDTVGGTIWYIDNDGDGFGLDTNTIMACDQPQGYVANSGDCNDSDASVRPGAQEVCDGKDNNCDGLTDGDDPSLVGGTIWYRDADFDGFGTPNVTTNDCVQPTGYVANSADCNDSDSSINPFAEEIIGDNIDNNCNGDTDEQPE